MKRIAKEKKEINRKRSKLAEKAKDCARLRVREKAEISAEISAGISAEISGMASSYFEALLPDTVVRILKYAEESSSPGVFVLPRGRVLALVSRQFAFAVADLRAEKVIGGCPYCFETKGSFSAA